MPELPDVEGFRRVAEQAAGKRVTGVKVRDPSVLRNTTGPALARSLEGHRFGSPCRRGKWLIAPVDGSAVLIHFGMTGLLEWQEDDRGRSVHDRVVFEVDGGRLVYRDQRKLQGVWFAERVDDCPSIIGEQGPDALGLSWRAFETAMGRRRSSIKAALMDQTVIAGLGNLLTDEILWRARVHPGRSWAELASGERRAVHRATQTVVRTSARHGEVPPRRDWLTSQREAPEPACPRCGTHLRRNRVGGRTSLWCPTCQPAGPPESPAE